jgi:hypothetical protein
MSSRHSRRKRAKAARIDKLIGVAQWKHSQHVAKTVQANKAQPIERNYYKGLISKAYLGETSARFSGQ